MTIQLYTLPHFNAQPAAWRKAVEPAVVKRLGAVLWIDTAHTACQRGPKAPQRSTRPSPSPAVPKSPPPTQAAGPTPASAWAPLRRLAATVDLSRVNEALDEFQAGLPNHPPHPRDQFAAMRVQHPLPPSPSRLELCRWVYDRQRQAPHRSGDPSPSYAAVAEADGWPADGIDLRRVFTRAVCISLDRRADRYQRFGQNLNTLDGGWPFEQVERLSAVDGWEQQLPPAWQHQGDGMRGAYGCSLSHRKALRSALDAGADSILIMEDDAAFKADFPARAAEFIAAVEQHDPQWEMLMFGGQPLVNRDPIPLGNGIARSVGTNRFHCYGVRGPLIRDLLDVLDRVPGHCDIVPWDLLRGRRVYEPNPKYLVAQAAGWSDISSSQLGVRAWSNGKLENGGSAIYLRSSRDVMEELAKSGWYFGGVRDQSTGVDGWLKGLVEKHSGADLEQRIRSFMVGIIDEAEFIGAVPALWHPELRPENARRSFPGKWIEIEASTAKEAESAISLR